MITRILIKNSPAFKLLDLELFAGFNVFSGASGSGKSVFMESLLAVFGLKDSNADLIEVALKTDSLDLAAYGILADDEELNLSILKKEKARYFLNHQASSKKSLSELTKTFCKHISARGDNDLSKENILRVLDGFICSYNSTHADLLLEFQESFSQYNQTKITLQNLEQDQRHMQSFREIAQFEVEKITTIAPKIGEYEELLELKKTLSRQEKIANAIKNVRESLETLGCVDSFLQVSESECPLFFEGLSELEALLDSKEQQLHSLEETNPEYILNRLSALSDLIRRYGSIEDALKTCQEQQHKLENYKNMESDKQEIEIKLKHLCAKLDIYAQQLCENRSKGLQSFTDALAVYCKTLRLKPLEIKLSKQVLQANGTDECILKLGGSEISTLSSGEYNRLRLALLCMDANAQTGILVLDEIDANLSGEESEGVAQVLHKLSKTYQVFAISHQPHMPSLADNHFLVLKNTQTSEIKLLDTQGRINEIARIISGKEISKEALEFAKIALSKNGVI